MVKWKTYRASFRSETFAINYNKIYSNHTKNRYKLLEKTKKFYKQKISNQSNYGL